MIKLRLEGCGLRPAGHCDRHGVKEDADSASVEVAGSLVLWEPTQGKRRVGGRGSTIPILISL